MRETISWLMDKFGLWFGINGEILIRFGFYYIVVSVFLIGAHFALLHSLPPLDPLTIFYLLGIPGALGAFAASTYRKFHQ